MSFCIFKNVRKIVIGKLDQNRFEMINCIYMLIDVNNCKLKYRCMYIDELLDFFD